MKFFLSLFIVFYTTCSINAQDGYLQFDYDSAGNQKIRELICISCNTTQNRIASENNNSEVSYIQSPVHEQVSYYPNPVSQELYIKWANNVEKHVDALKIYSMAGQKVMEISNLKVQENTSIIFQNFPQGFYNVVLYYNTGEKKTLKIVKK